MSCGGKSTDPSEKVETSDSSEKAEAKVDLATLYYSKIIKKHFKDSDSTELFTGIAEEKNSSDQVVRTATFKNGYLVSNKCYSDFNGKLMLSEDMDYKDGEYFNGWKIKIYKNDQIEIVRELSTYKNGRLDYKNSWDISNNEFDGDVSELWINHEVICSGGFYPSPKSFPRTKEFLKCCESKKLKYFKYVIF